MAALDDWILRQLAPHFLPGEAPLAVALTRNVVSMVTAMFADGARGVHNGAQYKYTALTTEHLFFIETSAQMGMLGGISGEEVNKGVQAFELLELVDVKVEVVGGWDTLTFLHRDGRALQQTIPKDAATTTQQLLASPHAANLAQALRNGTLRTPERLARLAQIDARLLAERQAAEAAAAAEAIRAAERLQTYNNAEEERIKRTIEKQPEILYRSAIAMVVVAALAGLFVLYNAANGVSYAVDSAGQVSEAATAKNPMNRKHAQMLVGDYAGKAVKHGAFAAVGFLMVLGGAGGGYYFRKRFRRENAELRQKYGLV